MVENEVIRCKHTHHTHTAASGGRTPSENVWPHSSRKESIMKATQFKASFILLYYALPSVSLFRFYATSVFVVPAFKSKITAFAFDFFTNKLSHTENTTTSHAVCFCSARSSALFWLTYTNTRDAQKNAYKCTHKPICTSMATTDSAAS